MLDKKNLPSFLTIIAICCFWMPICYSSEPSQMIWDTPDNHDLVYSNPKLHKLLIDRSPELAGSLNALRLMSLAKHEEALELAADVECKVSTSLKKLNESWLDKKSNQENFLRLEKVNPVFHATDFYNDKLGSYSSVSIAFASMDEAIIPAVSTVVSKIMSKDNLMMMWAEMAMGKPTCYKPSIEVSVFFPKIDEQDQLLTITGKLVLSPVASKFQDKVARGDQSYKGRLKSTLLLGLVFLPGSLAGLNSMGRLFSKSQKQEMGTEGFLGLSTEKFDLEDPFDVRLVKGQHYFDPDPDILNSGDVMASNALLKSSENESQDLLNYFKPHDVKKADYYGFMRRAYLVPKVNVDNFHGELMSQKDWIEATNSNLQYTGRTEDGFTVVKHVPFLDDVRTRIKVRSVEGEGVQHYSKLFPKGMHPDLVNIIEIVETSEPVIGGSVSIAQHYNLPSKGVLIVVDSVASINVDHEQVGWLKRKILTGIPESVRLYEFTKETKFNAKQTRLFCKRFL